MSLIDDMAKSLEACVKSLYPIRNEAELMIVQNARSLLIEYRRTKKDSDNAK